MKNQKAKEQRKVTSNLPAIVILNESMNSTDCTKSKVCVYLYVYSMYMYIIQTVYLHTTPISLYLSISLSNIINISSHVGFCIFFLILIFYYDKKKKQQQHKTPETPPPTVETTL